MCLVICVWCLVLGGLDSGADGCAPSSFGADATEPRMRFAGLRFAGLRFAGLRSGGAPMAASQWKLHKED